jgi:hypothetical protein
MEEAQGSRGEAKGIKKELYKNSMDLYLLN